MPWGPARRTPCCGLASWAVTRRWSGPLTRRRSLVSASGSRCRPRSSRCTWPPGTAVDGRTASVLLLGNLAGGYLLRTLVLEASGACAWDGATPFPSDMDPQAVWDQVEQQLDLIGAVGEWGPDEPIVVDVTGFGAGMGEPRRDGRPAETA